MNKEEVRKKFLTNTDETGRMVIKSLKTGKTYFVEAIGNGYNEKFGDIDPATKKMTGNYGEKYTGSVTEKESLIKEENGFSNIVTLKAGESPFDEIERRENIK